MVMIDVYTVYTARVTPLGAMKFYLCVILTFLIINVEWIDNVLDCSTVTKLICADQCSHRCKGPKPIDCCNGDCAGGCTGPYASECFVSKRAFVYVILLYTVYVIWSSVFACVIYFCNNIPINTFKTSLQ